MKFNACGVDFERVQKMAANKIGCVPESQTAFADGRSKHPKAVRKIPRFLACCCGLSLSIGFANELRPVSLAEMASRSDAVFFGRAIAIHNHSKVEAYATVKVVDVLKGAVSENVRVRTKGYPTEMNPECCDGGSNYLFFLVKEKDGTYLSLYGRYGMRKLPKE